MPAGTGGQTHLPNLEEAMEVVSRVEQLQLYERIVSETGLTPVALRTTSAIAHTASPHAGMLTASKKKKKQTWKQTRKKGSIESH